MGFIDYEVDGQVGIITINRPKALNALNSEVLKDLDATIDAVDLDAIRCLIITGAGEKSFVAGADIGEMSTLTKAEGEAAVILDFVLRTQYLDSRKLVLELHLVLVEHRDLLVS